MPMPGDAKIRASDAERDRTAAALREHLAAGRLTIEEFGERLDRALDHGRACPPRTAVPMAARLPAPLPRPGQAVPALVT
jgi:Domain of unknown function (DUF1707)